jgi:hypothetical protein
MGITSSNLEYLGVIIVVAVMLWVGATRRELKRGDDDSKR